MRNRGKVRSVRQAASDTETRGGYALQIIADLQTNERLRARLLSVDPVRFWLAAASMPASQAHEMDVSGVLDRAETVPLARLQAAARARTERLNERLRARRADPDAAGITTTGANA